MTGSKVPSRGQEHRHPEGAPDGGGEADAARLDEATNSDGGPWCAALYETAGEASLCFSVPPVEDLERPPPGEGLDPERAAQEAARRAATTLRRFCAHHGLDRLWSLTYSCRRCMSRTGCQCPEGPDRPTDVDLDQVVEDVARFRRRFNAWAGERHPLAIVIEHHLDGTLHVHCSANQYVKKDDLARLWGHGFVDLRRFRAKGLERLGKRERARMVASYMASYLKKDFTEGHQFGRHRYSTTRGMAPVPRRVRFHRPSTARAWWCLAMGGTPDHGWSSSESEHWTAPPVELAYWNDS